MGDVDNGGGAAVESGASGSEGGSGAEDTGATLDAGSEATEGAEGTETKSDVPRYKYRRFGKEQEHAAEELAKMLDDDYEHEFHGAGGKPLLVNGKPAKMKNAEIVRAVQMSSGAIDAMRRANESHERNEGLFKWASEDSYKNLPHLLEERVGLDQYVSKDSGFTGYQGWLYDQARALYNEEVQLAELEKSDHPRFIAEIRRREAERLAAKQRREQTFQQRQQSQQQHKQAVAEWERNVGAKLSEIGVPMNARTRAIAESIAREWGEAGRGMTPEQREAAGLNLTHDQLAGMVRDSYHEEIFGYIGGEQDDEKLLAKLPKRLRERLRNAELAALKGAKKQQAATTPKPANTNTNGAAKRAGLTAAQIMRGK
jgi:hypothetical protein